MITKRIDIHRSASVPTRFATATPTPWNLPRGFQRFGFENHFRAGVFSGLGSRLGLLMVKSSPGVNLKPCFGLILDLMALAPRTRAALLPQGRVNLGLRVKV